MKKVIVASLIGAVLIGGVVSFLYFPRQSIIDDFNKYKAENKIFAEKSLNDKFVTYNSGYDFSKVLTTKYMLDVINDTEAQFSYKVDESGLKSYIIDYNASAQPAENAYITCDNSDEYVVVDEKYGEQYDVRKLLKSVQNGDKNIKLDNYIIQPNIFKNDLVDKCEVLNQYLSWHVSYENGTNLWASSEFVSFDKNYNPVLDDSFIDDFRGTLDEVFDTVGDTRTFTTHSGEEIQVSGGTFGFEVDSDAEIEYLKEKFAKCEVMTDRTPIEVEGRYDEFGDDYIEVDIDNQHLWVYDDGEVIMETDVVTGTKNRRDTPKGTFFISECIDGKYLRGPGYVTWVNKWMRLTGDGVGLHDAGWRGRFGGQIYTYDGSHGCINLPKKFAYDLFEVAFTGEPVVIY